MTGTAEILAAIAALVAGGNGVWFWYDKKKGDAALQLLSTDIKRIGETQIKHSNLFVTDPRTREIVREEIEHIKTDVSHTKINVEEIKKLTQELITEIRVVNAVQKALDDKRRS